MTDVMSGTGAGLMAFLDSTWKRGLVRQNHAVATRRSCKEVLETVEGEDWESKDIRDLDLDDTFNRFETLRAVDYTVGSLMTYRSRFRKGVTMYREFLKDPGGWRPEKKAKSNGSIPARRKAAQPKAEAPEADAAVDGAPQVESASKDTGHAQRPDLMTYPFPLRRAGGVIFATLTLPHDLTTKEAERIAAHIRTLAIEDEHRLPRPTDDWDPHAE
jgi:hypothetical protein